MGDYLEFVIRTQWPIIVAAACATAALILVAMGGGFADPSGDGGDE